MIQRDLRKEPVHDGLKPIESALGQQRPLIIILAQRLLPGAIRPFV
jgi:hypothetical protein